MSARKPDTTYGNKWYNYLMGFGPYPHYTEAAAAPRRTYHNYIPWVNRQEALLRDVGEVLDSQQQRDV